MNDSPNFERREPPGKWVSMGLTVFVHVGLIVFLLVGVRWESRPPAAMEVQLVAAPTAPVAESRPAPRPQPAPKPEPPKPEPPKPEPPKPEPKPEPPKPEPKPEPPKPAPDIATKAPEPKPEPPKPEPPKPAPPKPEPPKPEPPKPEPPKPPPPKPEPPKPAPQPAQTPPDDYMVQRLAQELERAQIERLMRDDAARVAEARTAVSGGALGDYEARIQAHIKRNIVVPPSVSGDPSAEFLVMQAPDGTVTSVRQLSSSGIPALDAAIERAINRSSPLPLPTTQERPPRELRLTFRPLRD